WEFLRDRRNIRECLDDFRIQHGERTRTTRAHQFAGGRPADGHEDDVAPLQGGQARAFAIKRNRGHVDFGHGGEHAQRYHRGTARTGGTYADLAGARLDVLDQIGQRLPRRIRLHNEHLNVAAEDHQRVEFAVVDVRQAEYTMQLRVLRAEQDVVAVRGTRVHVLRRNRADAAGTIDEDDRLAKFLFDARNQNARQVVRCAARAPHDR